MKIARRRELIPDVEIRISGRPDKLWPTVGAAIAAALTAALDLAVGEAIEITEFGEVIGRAVRTEEGAALV